MNVYLDTKIMLNVLYCVHKYKNKRIYKNNNKSVNIIKLIVTNTLVLNEV